VFFDPDNGLETNSLKKGRKNSSKFAFLDELADYFRRHQSVLVYQHYPHVDRVEFVEDDVRRIRGAVGDAHMFAFEDGARRVPASGASPRRWRP
jgi:hypothetical protein